MVERGCPQDSSKDPIKAGDIIKSWTRGDVSGDIESPFDLDFMNTNQRPLGTVLVYGIREGQEKIWEYWPVSAWGVDGRPNFTGPFLRKYQQAVSAAGARHLAGRKPLRLLVPDSWDPPNWLNSWLAAKLARVYSRAGHWPEANAKFTDALRLLPVDDHLHRAQLHFQWAEEANQNRRWTEAEAYYAQADKTDLQANSILVLHSRVLSGLGWMAVSHGNKDLADKYFGEELATASSISPAGSDVADALMGLGDAAWMQQDWEGVQHYFTEMLKVQAPRLSRCCIVCTQASIGEAARELGNFDTAERYYIDAFNSSEGGSSSCLALPFFGLGLIAQHRGDIDGAERYMSKALSIQRKNAAGADATTVAILGGIGEVALDRGELGRARRYLSRAIAMQEKLLLDKVQIAGFLKTLGEIAFRQGDLRAARVYLLRALSVENVFVASSSMRAETLTLMGYLGAEGEKRGCGPKVLYKRAL